MLTVYGVSFDGEGGRDIFHTLVHNLPLRWQIADTLKMDVESKPFKDFLAHLPHDQESGETSASQDIAKNMGWERYFLGDFSLMGKHEDKEFHKEELTNEASASGRTGTLEDKTEVVKLQNPKYSTLVQKIPVMKQGVGV